MWSPTHVQVVVQRAKNLQVKGKHGTNDAFVIIQLGKEKFQTSVKEKSENPEWNEECELTIPDGNTSSILLTTLHRNFVGLDKFLGQIQIPLNELYSSVYERSRSRWYTLEAKPGRPNEKKRGELEVRITFTVKSVTGSLMDLSKKPKKQTSLPVKMVHSVGGSLMNLASKDKKLPHFQFKSLSDYGHKLSEKFPKRKSAKNKDDVRIDEHHTFQSTFENKAVDSEDEQYVFGLDPLSDDVQGPDDYEQDFHVDFTRQKESPPVQHSVVATSPPDRSQLPITEEKDQTLIKSDRKPALERRRSIATLPQVVESPFEVILKEEEMRSAPRWRRRLRKMKIDRMNPRRHTIEGLTFDKETEELAKLETPSTPVKTTPQTPVEKESPVSSSPPPVPIRSARHNSFHRSQPVSVSAPVIANGKGPVQSPTARKPDIVATVPVEEPVATPVRQSMEAPVSVTKNVERKLNVAGSKVLSGLPKDKLAMFEKMSKEDLVELVVCQQSSIDRHLKQVRDLEDYIDDLLVRVMETSPKLLQNPFKLSPSIRNDLADPKTVVRPCNYL